MERKKRERGREGGGGKARYDDEPITLVTNDCTIVRDVDTIGDVAAYVLWMRDRDGVQFTTPSQGIKSRQRGKVYYSPSSPQSSIPPSRFVYREGLKSAIHATNKRISLKPICSSA